MSEGREDRAAGSPSSPSVFVGAPLCFARARLRGAPRPSRRRASSPIALAYYISECRLPPRPFPRRPPARPARAECDLQALRVSHARCVDTALLYRLTHPHAGRGAKPALRRLAREVGGRHTRVATTRKKRPRLRRIASRSRDELSRRRRRCRAGARLRVPRPPHPSPTRRGRACGRRDGARGRHGGARRARRRRRRRRERRRRRRGLRAGRRRARLSRGGVI